MFQNNSQGSDSNRKFSRASKWIRFLRFIVSLRGGTDVQGTIDEISKGVKLRGANIWLLSCSALLASIGLDTNSSAVIIGAMLISPLMTPILGVGLGVAILDRALLRYALGSLGLATGISLVTAFLYFLFSPFGEITAELSARTTPTILDVGIAFFGGVAGVVAGSRKDKTTAIPGVAIATALMPPLCTAGYGLAAGSTAVFFGAFYLFFINSFFIALSTYLLALWLRFPKKADIDEEQASRVRQSIIAFAIIVTIPSGLILYGVLAELRTDRNIRTFIAAEFRKDDRQAFRWSLISDGDRRVLKIYAFGSPITKEEENRLRDVKSQFGLGDVELELNRMNVSPSEFKNVTGAFEASLVDGLRTLSDIELARADEILELREQVKVLAKAADPLEAFSIEVREQFQGVRSASWEPAAPSGDSAADTERKVLVIEFEDDLNKAGRERALGSIRQILKERWPKRDLDVIDAANGDPE